MPLAPAPTSDLQSLLRELLNGNMTNAVPLLDYLQESRLDDWRWLRERIGVLAVACYATPNATAAPGVVPKALHIEAIPTRIINTTAWQAFLKDVMGRFWLDLYTLESTLASLNDSLRATAGVFVAVARPNG